MSFSIFAPSVDVAFLNTLPHFLDLVLALGRYSCSSSSSPFCLLYQSKRVRRMEGRQYSARELMVLISYGGWVSGGETRRKHVVQLTYQSER